MSVPGTALPGVLREPGVKRALIKSVIAAAGARVEALAAVTGRPGLVVVDMTPAMQGEEKC